MGACGTALVRGVLLGAMVGCTRPASHPAAPPVVSFVSTGPPVAHVHGEAISVNDVQAVARDEGITDVRQALDRAIELHVLAYEARRRGLDRDPLVVDMARRAALQSVLVHTVEAEVRPDALPAADLEAGMHVRGFGLAHGELLQVIHTVVLVPHDADLTTRTRARAQAEAFRAQFVAQPDRRSETFEAMARAALPVGGYRTETLPGFDRQGSYGQGDLAAPFVAGAWSLAQPGDVSPVVETPFGFHVILLLARTPPLVRPAEEVSALVREELLWRLRHRALDAYLETLRMQYHATIREEALRAMDTFPVTQGDGT